MLASLDMNGKVPEAGVLVAGFGLTDEDHKTLKAGAGALAGRMIIHEVDERLINPIDSTSWTADYPPAVIGRLFLADLIRAAGARLLTIDSDMIINVSLRPLFEMELLGSYVAACHDVPRHEDLDYFNSGIMLLDVDRYKKFDVAQRSLDWLANQDGPVTFPDQDALNTIVGHIWHRLDHRWNFHCNYGEHRAVTANDYERAYVAHFAARKPWDDPTHPGLPLYRFYREELSRRMVMQAKLADVADATFVATSFQVLLGRLPADMTEYSSFTELGARAVVTKIVKSSEFLSEVLLPLITGDKPSSHRFHGQPSSFHVLWAAQRLNLTGATVREITDIQSWIDLLSTILCDKGFRAWSSNVQLMHLADAVKSKWTAQANETV
jgi:lipopolysaccharide biosynthesis glycosyltransferase